jgi:3-hydroxyacyl-[acyl-carrier-protein] dehydratase
MRWYWIDRFVEFESGRSARAVKNVSLSEDHLHDHFPGAPVMPAALIIEGCAQCGGLLVSEHLGFAGNMILAKVPKAQFHFAAVAGDTLTYNVTLEDINSEGAMITATSHVAGRLQADIEIFFANVSEGERARKLFEPADLVAMMHLLGAYRVGRAADGGPMLPPGHSAGTDDTAHNRSHVPARQPVAT